MQAKIWELLSLVSALKQSRSILSVLLLVITCLFICSYSHCWLHKFDLPSNIWLICMVFLFYAMQEYDTCERLLHWVPHCVKRLNSVLNTQMCSQNENFHLPKSVMLGSFGWDLGSRSLMAWRHRKITSSWERNSSYYTFTSNLMLLMVRMSTYTIDKMYDDLMHIYFQR